MNKKENPSLADLNDDVVDLDVESISENNTPNSSNIDVAEMDMRSRNLRTLCGCLLLFIIILVLATMYPIYLTFSTTEKVAGASADAISVGFKNTLDTIEKIVNQKPSADIVYGAQFVDAMPENKFIVAQVDEKIDLSPEFSKYGVLNASLRLTVEAHYQYYVPLRGIKFDVRKSRDDGKFHFTFYFDSLKCDTPVKYTEITRRAKPSNFSDDVNKELEEFQKTKFPLHLAERGKNPQNMMSASLQAQRAMEDYIVNNIIDCAGIYKDRIGKISIVFNSLDFESFKSGVKEKIGDTL